jgi:dolichol-phosphate mannosyltransferase
MKIVVVIPAYNEKENISRTVTTLLDSFKQIPNHEMSVLVTDANSPDGTADIVRELIKRYPNVHLIVEKAKRGLGAAYSDAMKYAFEVMNADYVITFDADLSHDPKAIPLFVQAFEQKVDYVCGTRYRKGGGIPKNWGWNRKLLSWAGNAFIRSLYFGSGMTDFTSGYKGISKNLFLKIQEKISQHGGYTFAISLNLEPIRLGIKPVEIPYHFIDRTLGKSKMGSEYFKNALIFVIKSRIADFLNSRLGKVFMAGGIGAISQLISYRFLFEPLFDTQNILNLSKNYLIYGFTIHPRFLISQLLAIEVGVFVSFYVNNVWAFGDKKLHGLMFLRRFAKNHLVVSGSILIQVLIAQILAAYFGIEHGLKYVYQIIGILVGLIWNFYFYKKIIWKVKN